MTTHSGGAPPGAPGAPFPPPAFPKPIPPIPFGPSPFPESPPPKAPPHRFGIPKMNKRKCQSCTGKRLEGFGLGNTYRSRRASSPWRSPSRSLSHQAGSRRLAFLAFGETKCQSRARVGECGFVRNVASTPVKSYGCVTGRVTDP